MMRARKGLMMAGGAGAVAGVAATLLLMGGPGHSPARSTPPGGDAGMADMEGTADMEGMAGMEGMADMPGAVGSGGDAAIRFTAADIANLGITFGTVRERVLVRTIRAVGSVEFVEPGMVYVAPRFGGWAEQLYVDFTGRAVRRGEALLEVYSPELVAAQEELLLAARMVESLEGAVAPDAVAGAQELLRAARRRLEYWDVPAAQVERLLEEGEVRRTLTLHAPASGIVMEKNVVRGQAFQAGTNLYMIADLSEVWVHAELFEEDVALVRPGMPATISVAAMPGRAIEGRVEFVHPTLKDRTRSMTARIALPNPGQRLKPGMYATVELVADLGTTLAVPAEAILQTGERAVAFVDAGEGRIEPREVALGMRGDGFVQVLDGLEADQRVVTSAQFLLDSEANLAEVMKAMMAQMNLSDMGGMDMGGMDMGGARPDTAGGR
ncbi:MAG: efflux RND transporter periplasmic adaptor subunit [Longimicrobiales bacterium]|nr:efflux RND transporter periplasmic adaptor subunit [Longimicrobiales bacterium]